MKEVFGYIRVSGKSQVDGDGFERQRAAITTFCDSRGWVVKRFFQEEAVSGTVDGMDRPAFSEMLGLCGDQLPVTIVVERADRLARDLIVGELILAECKKLGVEVFSADTGEEMVNANSDPTKVLIRQILGALAQWEKSALVKKMRVARERIRAKTGRCEGAKPYELLNPAESALVLAWIVAARQRGNSFHAITRQLNLGTEYRPPNGGKWQSSTVHKLYTRHMKQLTERND
jgi:DNA invertase Pin-like site-specific DNA recombinase